MAVDYDRQREDDNTDLRTITSTTRRGTSPDIGDDTDTANVDGWELAPETLAGDDVAVVIPQQVGEFTCISCFLVKDRAQLAHMTAAGPICRDCADDA